MRKMVLSILLVAFAAMVQAQETSGGSSQWLTEFSEINISGPCSVVLEQVAETEAPRILFDTKGSYTSKFKAEVKGKELLITEKFESARTTVTEVRVCYHTLDKIRISGATVTFAAPFKAVMLDASVSGGAVVTLPCDLTDLRLDVSGKSRAILTGDVRYLTLGVTIAKADAAQLDAMSVTVDASNKAEVTVNVVERLEAKVSTGGRVVYMGNPPIVRSSVAFTGGDIVKAQ